MKRLTILLLLLSSALAFGQNKELTADESIPIPKVISTSKVTSK